MSAKKEVRSDHTYMISVDPIENPKLGAYIMSNGKESLFLDYYFGFTKEISAKTGKEVKKKERRREYLSLYLWQAPRTPEERLQNKKTLDLAKKLRYERGQEMLENAEGYRIKKDSRHTCSCLFAPLSPHSCQDILGSPVCCHLILCLSPPLLTHLNVHLCLWEIPW